MHIYSISDNDLSEFYKIQKSGIDCVLLIRNDENIVEDNKEVVQTRKFVLNNVRGLEPIEFSAKYVVYYSKDMKDLGLPFCYYYDKNETNIARVMWFNPDYFFIYLQKVLKDYDFYFEIQHDCYLNAMDYTEFFKLYENDKTDFIAGYFRKQPPHSKSTWHWQIDIDWLYEEDEVYGCLWHTTRMSKELIQKIYQRRKEAYLLFLNTDKKAKWALSEIFVATECKKFGFSARSLENNRATDCAEIDLNNNRLFLNYDNCMYHPVKGDFLNRINKLKQLEESKIEEYELMLSSPWLLAKKIRKLLSKKIRRIYKNI